MAAKFEFEVMVSPSSARSLFQRALRLMPQQKKLWLEVRQSFFSLSCVYYMRILLQYFKLELLYVELVHKRQAVLDRTTQDAKQDDEDAVLQGKIIEIVFNNAQATITGKFDEVC